MSWPERISSVEHDLDVRADRIDDLRQRRDGRWRTVELPPAVIGNDERGRAGLRRRPGILDIENSLEDEFARPQFLIQSTSFQFSVGIELAGRPLRERVHVLHAPHVAGEIAEGLPLAPDDRKRPCRLDRDIDEVGEPDLGRHRHAIADVAMALTEHLQIDREHQRAALGGEGAIDQSLDEAPVSHHVELEPERSPGCLRHVLDRADRHGRKRERNAGRLGGAAARISPSPRCIPQSPIGARANGNAAFSPISWW